MGGALFVYGVVAVAVQGGLVRRVRLAPTTLVMIGMPITIAGLLALMLAPDSGAADRVPGYAIIVLGMALQGFGQGLVLPGVTSAMSLAVEDTEQGAIAGLNTSAQGMGRLIGPLFGGALYQLQTSAPYAVGAGLLATVLLFVIASPQMRAIAQRARDDGAQEKKVATTQSNAAAATAITGTSPSTDPTR